MQWQHPMARRIAAQILLLLALLAGAPAAANGTAPGYPGRTDSEGWFSDQLHAGKVANHSDRCGPGKWFDQHTPDDPHWAVCPSPAK
jgi:hypothetical protein